MKRIHLMFALVGCLGLTQFSAAQTPTVSNATNFAMIGITRGQTLQINVVAFPPDPCFAQLGFQDTYGNALGTTTTVTLQPGQSASLAINGNTVASSPGQRVQVLPTLVPTSVVGAAAVVSQCVASAEVFDNVLGITSVLIPGAYGFPVNPVFGMLGVTDLQTVRLNVVAFPPDPCIGQLSFVNSNGIQVGNTFDVQLAPGQAASFDLPGSTIVSRLGQRSEVRPVVTATNGGCVASAEVYLNGLGTTVVYYPLDPCSPSSTSCAAFHPATAAALVTRRWRWLRG
jgi:hypothetical protein